MSIFIAFFLFRDGVAAAGHLTTAVERMGGEQGKHLLTVAGQTIRGVVYGILGTALAQAVMTGIGLFIAGVPGAALLALLTFFASVVPVVGTGLVWIPAALWLFIKGRPAGASSCSSGAWAWPASTTSSSRGSSARAANMPFILIFFGVIGGALAFGFIGVFLGPTLLAVGYRLAEEWISSHRSAAPTDNAPTTP